MRQGLISSILCRRHKGQKTGAEERLVATSDRSQLVWQRRHELAVPVVSISLVTFKKPSIYIYSSFIHNRQNLEADQMSFNRWTERLWYLRTMEYYSVLKRNGQSSHETTQRGIGCRWWAEEAKLARPLTIWSQIYGHLENEKLCREPKTVAARGVGR